MVTRRRRLVTVLCIVAILSCTQQKHARERPNYAREGLSIELPEPDPEPPPVRREDRGRSAAPRTAPRSARKAWERHPWEDMSGAIRRYRPVWADVPPRDFRVVEAEPGLSSEENGARLAEAMTGLKAGQRLEIGPGTYSMARKLDLSLQGTRNAPIWIVARPGSQVIITRPDASQNTINIGESSHAEFLCLRGLEITGGSIALRLHNAHNVWIDLCHIHSCAHNAIAANNRPTSYLTFTRNEVHDTGGTGEGFYIGGNNSNPVTHHTVIALNHVHHTGGYQGDGIELKQGAWACTIAENYVHDTNYPSIIAYGTGGKPVNRIERNLCVNSNDNVLQVQGEALVTNNVLIGGKQGFGSHDHQGQSRDLVFAHNTIITRGAGVNLEHWTDRPGMVFANNAIYSQGPAVTVKGGGRGVTVAGNVIFGRVSGFIEGFTPGTGLEDFVNASWDGTRSDLHPAQGSPLLGAAEAQHTVEVDHEGRPRRSPGSAGAFSPRE